MVFDTPGFGDTSGRDEKIYKDIEAVLKNPDMLDSIHAICFVGNASLVRLTASQNYII